VRTRRRGLLVVGTLVVLGGIGWGADWYAYARNTQSTDDAYVSGDIVQVTNEVAGTVMALHADDTQTVQHGQPLVELDPADADIAMASAQAGLAQAVRQVRALIAEAGQLRAQIVEREASLRQAQNDLKRREALAASGGVSAEEIAHGRDAVTELSASLDVAHGQLNQVEAQIAGTSIETHPLVLAAAARLRDAALARRRTLILAPVDGVIARRGVQLGQRLAPGTPLMAVVPLDDVWVDANFKEVQLDRMRIGQPVTLTADLWGGNVVYHGKVAGLSAGSGTAFSLLPAQNATGNWIKIIQRVPVRILLDPREVQAHPLRIGLSISATVDIHDQSGPPVATPLRSRPLPVRQSDGDEPAITALIAQIIADNARAATPVPKGNPS
jgi:membrane fusion protein (multidrug efflux system)